MLKLLPALRTTVTRPRHGTQPHAAHRLARPSTVISWGGTPYQQLWACIIVLLDAHRLESRGQIRINCSTVHMQQIRENEITLFIPLRVLLIIWGLWALITDLILCRYRSYLLPVLMLYCLIYCKLLEAWRPPATAHYWSMGTAMSAGFSTEGPPCYSPGAYHQARPS